MLRVDLRDIAIITVKRVDYCCIIHGIRKSEAIKLLENFVLRPSVYLKRILKNISIKNRAYNYYVDNLIRANEKKGTET